MPMGILFWVLMILWALSCFGWYWYPADRRYGGGFAFLLFIVIALLGWRVFGAVLQ